MDTDSIESTRGKYECPDCGKFFVTRYNRNRHIRTIHDEGEEEEESENSISDRDSVNDEASISDSQENADEDMEDDEREEEEEESEDEQQDDSIFANFVHNAVASHKDEFEAISDELVGEGMSEDDAEMEAHEQLMPRYSKSLRKIFIHYMVDMIEKRNHPLFKAIMKKASEFEKDGFDIDAAIKAAVSYRKHSIENLIAF